MLEEELKKYFLKKSKQSRGSDIAYRVSVSVSFIVFVRQLQRFMLKFNNIAIVVGMCRINKGLN